MASSCASHRARCGGWVGVGAGRGRACLSGGGAGVWVCVCVGGQLRIILGQMRDERSDSDLTRIWSLSLSAHVIVGGGGGSCASSWARCGATPRSAPTTCSASRWRQVCCEDRQKQRADRRGSRPCVCGGKCVVGMVRVARRDAPSATPRSEGGIPSLRRVQPDARRLGRQGLVRAIAGTCRPGACVLAHASESGAL